MITLKRLFHRAVHRTGLHVGRFPVRHSPEANLRRLFGALGVNCVLDVGGHHGEFALQLRALGYRGRIVSFEPISATCAVLHRNARLDRDWHVHQIALGSEHGERQMNVYNGTVFNSFLRTTELAEARFGASAQCTGSERVALRRLDQIFGQCVSGIARPRVFLKMDTQGWDLEVIEGARGILHAVVALQTELAIKHCYRGMTPYARALERFEGLGFDLASTFPVAFDRDGLRLVEVDCVFVAARAAT